MSAIQAKISSVLSICILIIYLNSLTHLISCNGFGNKVSTISIVTFTSLAQLSCNIALGAMSYVRNFRFCCAAPKLTKRRAACRFYAAHSTNAESVLCNCQCFVAKFACNNLFCIYFFSHALMIK